jgi:hypothetical protein
LDLHPVTTRFCLHRTCPGSGSKERL